MITIVRQMIHCANKTIRIQVTAMKSVEFDRKKIELNIHRDTEIHLLDESENIKLFR